MVMLDVVKKLLSRRFQRPLSLVYILMDITVFAPHALRTEIF